jgi:hypothetical protein
VVKDLLKFVAMLLGLMLLVAIAMAVVGDVLIVRLERGALPALLRAADNAGACLGGDADIVADVVVLRRAMYAEDGGDSGADGADCSSVVLDDQVPAWYSRRQLARQAGLQDVRLNTGCKICRGIILQGLAKIGDKRNIYRRRSENTRSDSCSTGKRRIADDSGCSGGDYKRIGAGIFWPVTQPTGDTKENQEDDQEQPRPTVSHLASGKTLSLQSLASATLTVKGVA